MNRKLIELCKQFLLIQMNHWVLVPVFVALLGLSGYPKPYMLLWFLMSAIPMYLYFVRSKIKNFFFFYLLHLVVPALWIVLPNDNLWLKVLLGFLALFYIIQSICVKVAGKGNSAGAFLPLYAISIIGLSAVAHDFWGENTWDAAYLTAALIYLGCYFIHHFIEQYNYFISVNQFSASNIPELEIFTTGMKQTLTFSAAGLGVLFMTANLEWFSYIAVNLFRAFLAAVGFIYHLIFGNKQLPSQSAQEEVLETGAEEILAESENVSPILEWFWKILEFLVMAALIIAVVCVFIYGIRKGYQFLRKHFTVSEPKQEQVMKSGRDIREAIAVDKEEHTGFKLFAFRDNTEKVRKLYKKYILKNKNAIIGESDAHNLDNLTAKECCDKLSAEGLRGVYEKARYSAVAITAEDIKLLKHMGR